MLIACRFLLAHLHMELLVQEFTPDGIQQRLANLPLSSDTMYEAELKRIKAQDPQRRKLAVDVFSWLLFALRPLTLHELGHALAVRREDSDLTTIEDCIVGMETLTSVCAGIVSIDQKSSTIRLVHYTARGYLLDHLFDCSTVLKAKGQLTRQCLMYLSAKVFGTSCESREEQEQRMKKYPFLDYAAEYWHHHLQECLDDQDLSQAERFLHDRPKLISAIRAMSSRQGLFDKDKSSLHLVTSINCPTAVRLLLKRRNDINSRTNEGETPLHVAAALGYEEILELLINKGADVNARDKYGQTALHKAAVLTIAGPVKILSRNMTVTDINSFDMRQYTALRSAAHQGNELTVRPLVENGANLDTESTDGWNALRDAACCGHEHIAHFLIQKGAKHTSGTPDGSWSALCWAASHGSISIAELLLSKGTDLAATNEGWSALRWSVEYGHGDIAWLLLQSGEDVGVNSPDDYGCTPLHAAVKRKHPRHPTLYWLLLEHRADPNACNSEGRTPLHAAADEGDSSVLSVLLDRGAYVDKQDKTGKTALHLAALRGESSVARSLIDRNANINQANKGGKTALHLSSYEGNAPFVRLLLKHGADPNIRDASGKTALHWAMTEFSSGSTSHREVIRSIIDDDTMNINIQDDDGISVLHIIASQGSCSAIDRLPCVLDLLDRGACSDLGDCMRNTPLHGAICESHAEVVHAMVRNGAVVDVQDEKGWSAVHFAARVGNQDILNSLLIHGGGNQYLLNVEGLTPLDIAAEAGQTHLNWNRPAGVK